MAGGLGGGAGKAKVLLCGHSMGGLLIGRLRALSTPLLSQGLLDSGRRPGDSTNQGLHRSTTMATCHWNYCLRHSRESLRHSKERGRQYLTSVPWFASKYVQKQSRRSNQLCQCRTRCRFGCWHAGCFRILRLWKDVDCTQGGHLATSFSSSSNTTRLAHK